MEKPGNKLLIWTGLSALTGLMLYVINRERGIANEVVAAYLQALLSAGAILASVLIAERQSRHERRRAAGRQVNAVRLAVLRNRSLIESATTARQNSPKALAITKAELQAELGDARALKSDELSNAGYLSLFLLKSSLQNALDACERADADGIVRADVAGAALEQIGEAQTLILAVARSIGIDGSKSL